VRFAPKVGEVRGGNFFHGVIKLKVLTNDIFFVGGASAERANDVFFAPGGSGEEENAIFFAPGSSGEKENAVGRANRSLLLT
jgi:hypothetical protein